MAATQWTLEERSPAELKGPFAEDWQRGLAIACAIPAIGFAVSLVPSSGTAIVLAVRATVFATAVLGLRRAARGRHRSARQSKSNTLWVVGVVALIGLTSLDATSGVALSLLIASTEEVVFRLHAMDFVTGGSNDRRRLFVASVAAQCAFATSHFASGALLWAAEDWLALAGAGGCLGVLRYSAGLPITIALHFILNEISRTGAMGALIRPEPLVLSFVAIMAPLLCALNAPRLEKQPAKVEEAVVPVRLHRSA